MAGSVSEEDRGVVGVHPPIKAGPMMSALKDPNLCMAAIRLRIDVGSDLARRCAADRSATMSDCQLYLISPLDVSGTFPDRLEKAVAAGPVAAFQFRVKDMDQHDAAHLAGPLQEICAQADIAFIVNDSISLAKRFLDRAITLPQMHAVSLQALGQ